MALNYDNVTAITHSLILPNLVDQIFNSNPLMMKLYQKGQKLSGGTKIVQPLEYGTAPGGSYSGYDQFSLVPADIITAAEFNWKDNYVTISISGDDERMNSGEAAVINLLTAKVNNARRTLQDNMGYQLFSFGTSADTQTYGRGAKGITGLRSAIDDSSNVDTYGGVTRSDNTWWKSGYSSWSATAVSEYAIQGIVGDRTIGNDSPDMLVTSQDIYDKIFSILTPLQRFQDNTFAQAGFKSIIVSGYLPIVVDAHCASTDMFFINSKYIDLVTHQDANFKSFPFASAVDQPDVKSMSIIWQGNLVSSNCRMQARVHSVNVAL